MTINHHPPEELLSGFAAGVLDLGQHIAVATHLVACRHCRGSVRAFEDVGGTLLAGRPPTEIAMQALGVVEARLSDGPWLSTTKPSLPNAHIADVAGLPRFVMN